MTWVPWTYGRLSYASGYGAGIRSPGWYDHLFSSPGQPIERWLARGMAPVACALSKDLLTEQARRMATELREPPKKEDSDHGSGS